MRQLFLFCLVLCVFQSANAAQQVPFGDTVSRKIFNYHRHTPFIATSGRFEEGAIKELTEHGFKTIVDLRTVKEGVATTATQAREAGLNYYNLPVARGWPDKKTFEQFAKLVEDSNNFPILLRCGSANRVGMVWANYRLSKGVSLEAAILEGRTIGMKASREQQLKKNWLNAIELAQ